MSGPFQPTTAITLALPRLVPDASAFQSGATLRGLVVANQTGGLALQVGQHQVALPASANLTAGDVVTVQVTRQNGQVQLHVQTQATTSADALWHGLPARAANPSAPANPSAVPTPPNATSALQHIAQQLARMDATAAQLPPGLYPPQLPLEAGVARALFALFTAHGVLGRDLHALSALLTRAAAAGALPPDVLERFTALQRRFANASARSLEQGLQAMRNVAGQSAEARLAEFARMNADAAGSPASAAPEITPASLPSDAADLRQLLARIETAGLRAHLQQTGELDAFTQLRGSLLDRLASGTLQNARALEQPYFFMELPFPPNSGVNGAQVHFFSDGRGHGADLNRPAIAEAALDLELSQLGPMWVHVRLVGDACECHFRTPNENVAAALRADNAALTESLNAAGFMNVRIAADQWNGDRIDAVEQLMRRFADLDVVG